MRDTAEIMPDAGDDAVEIAALAVLTPMAYGRCRVAEAKRLGVAVAILDSEVAKAREAIGGKEDRPAIFRTPDPWGEPVTTAEMLDATVAAVRRHVILHAAAADCVALWVAHTWVFEQFQHTPRLAVTSPTMRCGKSTLLDFLHALCRRALKADNITAAALFRVVELYGPTLAVDEADSFLAGREELRGILNSGYEAHGSAIRVEKNGDGEHEPKTFSTFAPLAIAAIGRIPGTVADRAVPITLKRKLPGERVEKMRLPASRTALADLARMLARWSADHVASLSPEPEVPDQLNDRQGDIAVPLLSIADQAGEGWAKRARASLLETFGADPEPEAESPATLLADIAAAFAAEGSVGHIRSTVLVDFLFRMDDRTWGEMNHGKGLSARQLSAMLAPFGVRSRPLRIEGEVQKGYRLADFADAFGRYLTASSPYTPLPNGYGVTAEESLGVAADSPSVTGGERNRSKKGLKPAENLGCNPVTATTPPTWGQGVLQALQEAANRRAEMTAALAIRHPDGQGEGASRVLPRPAPPRGCAEPGTSLPGES